MKLSIIVPVYNAERYLPKCLDSLLNQGIDETDYEIICVDDGSTDASLDLLCRYAEKYPCIKVYSQSHSGLGNTRNTSLDLCSGDIVTFCDADDYLIPNGLRYVIDKFWDEQTDVLCHASTTIDNSNANSRKENNELGGVLIRQAFGKEIYERDPKYFVWNTLIRRRFIEENNLRFMSMVMTEDSYFMLELMMKNPRTKDVSSNIYRYMSNDGQLTRQRNGILMRQCIESYIKFISRLQYYGLSSVVNQQLIPFYSRILSASLNRIEFRDVTKTLKSMKLPTCSYFLYYVLGLLHRNCIVPYILPRLSRG